MVKSSSLRIFFITLLAAALLLGLVGAAAYSYFQVSGRIAFGVYVNDPSGGAFGEANAPGDRVHLGGMSVEQAGAEITVRLNEGLVVQVSDGMQTLTIPAAALGLYVDGPATALAAAQVAHSPALLVNLAQAGFSLTQGWPVTPQVGFDAAAARQGLESLSAQISRPAQDAALQFQGGELVTIPAQVGYTLDVEKSLARLSAGPESVLADGRFQLDLLPLAPQIGDVSALHAHVSAILAAPPSLALYDPITDERAAWPVDAAALASWMTLDPASSIPVVYEPARIAAWLGAQNIQLSSGRFIADPTLAAVDIANGLRSGALPTLIVRHPPGNYQVQPGDTLLKIGWKTGMPYWRIQQANPGMDPNALSAGQTIVIPSPDVNLPLPVVPSKRIVISISQQRLWTYQDGQLRSKHVISTGIDRSPTQPGIFQVQSHEPNAYASVWDLYMPDFLGIYESWPGFMNGIHGLPTLSNGRRLWANVLGSPASYGCIILDLPAAADLYAWAENGVVVVIEP